jgi:hypothetical protein
MLLKSMSHLLNCSLSLIISAAEIFDSIEVYKSSLMGCLGLGIVSILWFDFSFSLTELFFWKDTDEFKGCDFFRLGFVSTELLSTRFWIERECFRFGISYSWFALSNCRLMVLLIAYFRLSKIYLSYVTKHSFLNRKLWLTSILLKKLMFASFCMH